MGQQFRSVGGAEASPQILDACFGRMVLWVELCKETLQAEWPTFEALQCFSVFQLRPRLQPQVIRADLAKIATIFGERHELPVLIRSFTDCEYTASKRSTLANKFVSQWLKLRSMSMRVNTSHWPSMIQWPLHVTFGFSIVAATPRRPDIWQRGSPRFEGVGVRSENLCSWKRTAGEMLGPSFMLG